MSGSWHYPPMSFVQLELKNWCWMAYTAQPAMQGGQSPCLLVYILCRFIGLELCYIIVLSCLLKQYPCLKYICYNILCNVYSVQVYWCAKHAVWLDIDPLSKCQVCGGDGTVW